MAGPHIPAYGGRQLLHSPRDSDYFLESGAFPALPNARGADGAVRADEKELLFIGVVAVAFQSDHQKLTDKDDNFDAGGDPLPVDWTWKLDSDTMRSESHPVSHTAGQKVRLAVTVSNASGRQLFANLTGKVVSPKSAAGMQFVDRGRRYRPGDTEIVLESDTALGTDIERALFSVDWELSGANISASQLTYNFQMVYGPTFRSDNELFITLGEPRLAGDGEITTARMRHAVEALAKAVRKAGVSTSKDIYKVVTELILSVGFNLAGPAGDAWYFARNPDARSDCITIARYVEAVLHMAGIPGDAEAVIVYPRPKSQIRWKSEDPRDDSRTFKGFPAPSAVNTVKLLDILGADDLEIVAEKCPPPPAKAGLSKPLIKHKTQDWHLMLVDGNGGLNNFEGTVKFTPQGKKPRWYPAGTGLPGQEKMEDVIRNVFSSLSWVDAADNVQTPAVKSYP